MTSRARSSTSGLRAPFRIGCGANSWSRSCFSARSISSRGITSGRKVSFSMRSAARVIGRTQGSGWPPSTSRSFPSWNCPAGQFQLGNERLVDGGHPEPCVLPITRAAERIEKETFRPEVIPLEEIDLAEKQERLQEFAPQPMRNGARSPEVELRALEVIRL